MKELNEKLARWAGFENEGGRTWWAPGVEHHIVSQYYENYRYLPDFTESLDACIKWLVPKLNNYSLCKGLEPGKPVFGQHIAEVWSLTHGYGKAYSKNSALALCLAIEKLIDKEVLDE